jgi:cytochrome c
MKKLTLLAVTAALSMNIAFAQEKAEQRATRDEAVAMVKAGIEFAKAGSKEKLYADLNSGESQFKKHDLYLVVYGLDGYVHAHGAIKKFIGKNLIDLKDVDGKEFVRERTEMGRAKGTFWQEYKMADPTTKKVTPKSMYCERLTDVLVCGGVYNTKK